MENKILLQDLAQGVSTRTSIQKKDADNFVRNVFDIIIQYLQEEKIVKIKGLGTFKVVEVSGRDSVNVNTGERIHISGHSKITFTPDASLRDQINRPFADFETIIINEGIDLAEMERVPETEVTDEEQDETTTIDTAEQPMQASVQPVELPAVADEQPAVEAKETVVGQPTEESSETVDGPIEEENPEATVALIAFSKASEEQPVDEIPAEEVVSPGVDTTDSSEEETSDITEENTTDSTEENAPEPILEGMEDISYKNQQDISDISSSNEDQDIPETGDDKSDEDNHQPGAGNESEKVVYIERRPCKYCRICFVLLTFALMTLSYLAGHQHWFNKEYADREKSMNELLLQMSHSNVDTTTVTRNDTITTPPVQNDSISTEQPDNVEIDTEAGNTQTAPPASTRQDQIEEKPQTVKPANGKTPSTTASKERGLNDNSYTITGTRCNHTVLAGEGLYKIARLYYNDMNMATYIVRHNGITNPDNITEGTILRIPELRKKE